MPCSTESACETREESQPATVKASTPDAGVVVGEEGEHLDARDGLEAVAQAGPAAAPRGPRSPRGGGGIVAQAAAMATAPTTLGLPPSWRAGPVAQDGALLGHRAGRAAAGQVGSAGIEPVGPAGEHARAEGGVGLVPENAT